jgi:thiamine biosynthesis lipoprotein
MTATRHNPGRRRFLAMTTAALAVPGIARGGSVATERLEGHAFATTWSIMAPAGAGLERLRPSIETLLARVDRQMSPWRADSEITAVNRGPAGRYDVSDDTAHVCQAALRVAEASGGAFDPTVGPLVSRWGFGPIEGDASGDWRDIRVTGAAIETSTGAATVDLCGIAKGWALDGMARLLAEAGIDRALLDLGGEIRGIGAHPSGRAWRVAVEDPRRPGTAIAALELGTLAVATSGLTRQSFEVGGRTYGHIVDPRSHAPAAGALRSVSVVHEQAMMADAWATALFAEGAGAGPALARRSMISALFLVEMDGRLVPEATGAAGDILLW